MARVPPRLTVAFTAQSRRDLGEIWDWNAEERGVQHADQYVEFLRRETRKLASATNPGREIASSPAYRYYIIKRRSRGHGHVVVIWTHAQTLHVLRYFHTSQDWESKLVDPPH